MGARSVGLAWLLVGLGCSGSHGTYAIGSDLHGLPRAGAQPLMGMVPARAELALAIQNPRATWRSFRESAAFKALGEGPWADLQALPQVERWRALQARLSELARVPVPGLSGLLDEPAVVAWVPASAGKTGAAWLYIARVDESLPEAWAFVRALNVVRSSARDVEVARAQGLPVREVAIGGGSRLAYALLADRLMVSSDSGLVAEAVGLALQGGHGGLGASAVFADLETRAASVGFAVAFTPHQPRARLLGVKAAELDGSDLSLQLDPALWAAPDHRLSVNPQALLRLDLSGLDAGALLARMLAELPASPDDVGRLLQRLAAVSPGLGRGVLVEASPWQAGIGVTLDAVRRAGDLGSGLEALAEALLAGVRPAENQGSATLRCSEDDEVCLVVCPTTLRLAWPGAFARAAACPTAREQPPAAETAQATVWVGGSRGGLTTQVRAGRGRLEWQAL